MSGLQIFEGHQVEVLEVNGQVLFNPYHVGQCLDISPEGVRKAITHMNEQQVVKLTNSKVTDSHFKNSDVTISNIRKLHNTGENFLTESGVYKLVFKSRKPNAEKFTDWVTVEVLPSIRKTGGYTTAKAPQGKELLALAVLEAQKTIEAQNAEIARMKPKEVFADSVTASHTSILIGELAKLIRQNGVNIGGNRLFTWLRENGYLIRRKGMDYNMPTQRSIELGLFEVKETSINHSDGHTSIKCTPKVTGKGQVYFINKFLAGTT